LIESNEDDAQVGKRMLECKSKNISSFLCDSAYDDLKFRGVLDEKTQQAIPPPKNAVDNDIKARLLKLVELSSYSPINQNYPHR